MTTAKVRAANAADLPAILMIERSAAEAFRDVGYPQLADGAEMPLEFFEAGLENGFLWVATDSDDRPVGYALAAILGGLFYLEDISVDPAFQRRGLGDALLLQVIEHAKFLYCGALVLSTLKTVPWSEPFYRKHGFLEADPSKLPAEISEKFNVESEFGLPPEDRIVMIKPL